MKSCRVSFGNAVNARIFQPAKNACWNVLVGRFLCRTAALLAIAHLASNLLQAEEPAFGERERNLLRTFCVDCHGNEEPKAHLNLQELTDVRDEIRRFRVWEKVASVIAERRMPPGESDQPSDGQRRTMVFGIREHLDDVAQLQAGQPGRVTLRRLSSAEYAYSIEDLTGTQFDLDRILIGDAVGGEGFTNVGDVQFVQDSTIERYLEAAKLVASRAVIGAGPLIFADDAGPTGQELSAIRRIQAIYRKYGFRAAAGEGADSFGLEVYARAFFTVWRFENRVPLGEPLQTLDEIASEEGVPPRFASHIRRLVTSEGQSSPLRDIADEFRRLPTRSQDLDKESVASAARRGCDALFQSVRNWQRRLAPQVGDGEEAPLLANGKPALNPSVRFKTSCYWPVGSSEGSLVLQIRSAMDLDEQSKDAFIRWSNSRMQFVLADRKRTEPVPLLPKLKPESRAKLKMIGQDGSEPTEANTFVTEMGQSIRLEFAVPEGAISAIVSMEAALPEVVEGNPIIRCTVMNGWSQASTAADSGETSAIIGVPKGPAYERWLVGATEFAQSMPDASHREPAPSDRDPIPLPYDNTYNNPERNDFHYKIKYHRQDQFLVDALLDDVTRIQIDQAWADLLTSFDYHQTFLEFIGGKYSLDLGPRRIGALDAAWLEAVPLEAREYVEKLQLSYHDAHQRLEIGFAGHLVDLLRFADRAWRRPLTDTEQAELREFYGFARTQLHLDHVTAVRAVIMRILVAPAYLYRLEPRHEPSRVSELTAQELASRLSLFLWSSLPDDELRKAALEGRLKTPEEIELHARRMARDPKARRFASEFFCQWFGIYRFQEYTGVDTQRFPEFDARLRASMQEEAVAFFEYLIRENRPADEILFAEYSFWNRQLAEHYGIAQEELEGLGADFKQMGNLTRFRRGGLLGLAAIQTVTSAPLRTSPVKRGDWILRRVLGTPVPPPPADAGSIPADDLLPDGQSALDRLIAHRKNATCVNCHARMDPLGFALENFDPIGRWREAYRDGRPVETSGTLSDGTAIEGPDGLREYLQSNRLSFRRILCVKMLGYALGRSELLTDRALIEQMMVDLEHGGTVVDLAVRVSTSPQFRFRETHDSSEHSADGQHLKSNGGEDATNQ